MRKTALALGLLVAAAALPAAQGAVVTYKATINAAAEVPATTSKGSGTAAVNADAATKQVSWNVSYSGLSGPTGAHSRAAASANAGVAVISVPLSPARSRARGR
jgi:hypothetical protein